MSTNQTDLLLNAKTRGFERSGQQIGNLGKASKKAMEEAKREVDRLEGSLRTLVRRQVEVNRALEGTKKGTESYRDLTNQLKSVQQESARAASVMQALEKAYDSALKKRGSFAQGLMQGVTPAAFLQRGPGMMQQAGGQMAGRSIRGMAGGVRSLASSPFSGASGLVGAVQSIPGVGGALALPMQQALGQAQNAMAFKHMQMSQTPYLGGTKMLSGMSRARRGIAGVNAGAYAPAGVSDRDVANRVSSTRSDAGLLGSAGNMLGAAGMGMIGGALSAYGNTQGYQSSDEARKELVGENRKDAARRLQGARSVVNRKRAAAARRVQKKYIGDIRSTGQNFAYDVSQATQMAGSISAAGGGSGLEMGQQGLLGSAMAAERGAGVGANVSGAFLQGGRSGGVVGGMGRSGDALTDALKDGMRMGLEGSELQDYMSQMAADIRGWRSSGIPVNPASIAQMGMAFAKTGVGGVRGTAMAQGLRASAKNLSTGGPKTAAEFAVFEELGGFKGGGAQGVEDAQLALEEGNFSAEAITNLVKKLSPGGGARGRANLRTSLKGLGVNIGVRESRLLQGGNIGEEEVAMFNRASKSLRGGKSTGDNYSINGVAAGIDGAMKRETSISSRKIDNGQTMVGTMQNMESSMISVAKGFTSLAAAPLLQLTSGIAELSAEIPKLTEKLKAANSVGEFFSTGAE